MNKLDGDIAVERLNSAVSAFLDIVTEPEGVMVPVPERDPQPSLAERVKQNLKPSTDKAQGFAEEAKQAAIDAKAAADAAGSAVQVDVFTASGTWKKPEGAKAVRMLIIGAGGGGQSGAVGEPGSRVVGGNAGSGGGMMDVTYPADRLPSSASVVVGKGGAGGMASARAANTGKNGGRTAVRISYGVDVAAPSGAGIHAGKCMFSGGAAGMGGNGAAGGLASSGEGGASGGSGGGGILAGTYYPCGAPVLPASIEAAMAVIGFVIRQDGASGQDMAESAQYRDLIPGMGAPGGASSVVSHGGKGGNALRGGGGGGGGAAYAPYLSGAGGDGGDGLVIITTFM